MSSLFEDLKEGLEEAIAYEKGTGEVSDKMEVRDMLDELTKKIRPVFGNAKVKIILYGSYARGDYNQKSDIDLMILTEMSDDEIVAIEDRIVDIAYEYELKEGIPISINIKNVDQFKYWMNTLPYYQNIVKEGVYLNKK